MRSPGLGVGQEESGLRSLEELSKKAQELKEKGMSTYEISDELKGEADTVVWLLLHGRDSSKPRGESYDVYVNWNPIGSSVRRLRLVVQAIAYIVRVSLDAGMI